ncbi:MAG: HD domain-containing phosphohydrolase [Planctomycetota bacterium]
MCDAAGASSSLDITALRAGKQLAHSLYDGQGRLLLASGTMITDHFLEMLRSRGIERVQTDQQPDPSPKDLTESPAETPASDTACSSRTDRFADTDTPANPEAFSLTDRTRPEKTRLDPDAFEHASQQAAAHAEQLLGAWEDQGHAWLEATRSPSPGHSLDAGPASELLNEVLPVMALDVDLAAVMVGLSKTARQPILTHGVRTALVAMHLAQQVGYPNERIIDAGVTGMLADIGMARLPEYLISANRPLKPTEWIDVHRHPAYSADLLEHAGVSTDVRIAIYQHHERIDGSGYPHGRKGFFLHPLAKLLAVADTYAALSEPRHHRPAQSAHHAVKAVLLGVKAGQLDPTVGKLLVDTVGLFPVGLRVDVRDREAKSHQAPISAQVLRSPAEHPDRPFLVTLDAQGQPTKKKIDLAVRDELAVIKVYNPDELPDTSLNAA